VRKAIAAVPDGASKATVLAATGLNDAALSAAVNALLNQGTILRTGQGRGTRYLLRGEGANA
jgi:hypothetical protein